MLNMIAMYLFLILSYNALFTRYSNINQIVNVHVSYCLEYVYKDFYTYLYLFTVCALYEDSLRESEFTWLAAMKRNKQINIKGALALASTFHFLYSCDRACILPFLTLYLRYLGLTPSMTGLLMSTKHLISLVWSPLASFLSKHYNKRRAVITGSLVCSAGAALVLLLIPSTGVETLTSHCNISHLSVSPTEELSDFVRVVGSVMPTTHTTIVSQSAAHESSPTETTSYTVSSAVSMSKATTYTLQLQHSNNVTSQWSQCICGQPQ